MLREGGPRPDQPRLRIGQLAARTGVDAATLRTWEARYGVPIAERGPGGQRRYPEDEVERIQSMKRLIDAGYRASEAARLVAATWEAGSAGPERPPSRDELVAELTEGDLAALRELDRAAARLPLEEVLENVVAPVLHEVGVRWADRRITVAEEHAASAIVGAWLGAQTRWFPPVMRPGTVVTAAPEGERHELGLVMLGMFLRRQAVRVLHLGSDLPADELCRMIEPRGASVVVLGVSTALGHVGLLEAIDCIRDLPAPPVVAVGGPWSPPEGLPADVEELPIELSAATARIVQLLEPGDTGARA